jgi:hypothetical protein
MLPSANFWKENKKQVPWVSKEGDGLEWGAFSKQARERMLACNILDDSEEMGSSEAEAVVDEKKLRMTVQ